jgi:hypothetical protein
MSEQLSSLVSKPLITCLAAAALTSILGISAPAAQAQALQEQRAFYIFFKVPGSTQTFPLSINSFFTITGSYTDQNGTHGFLRDVFGKITSFDVPDSISTNPIAISDEGTVTGTYQDSNKVTHGFVRDPRGRLQSFDPPGSTNTSPTSINTFGAIAGVYFDANGPEAFVRSPGGSITTFQPGGRAEAINLFGAIVGSEPSPGISSYPPPTGPLVTGFLRSPKGAITLIQDPSAGSGGTFPTGIDAFGDIVGFFINGEDYEQVFFRDAGGSFTTVAPPNSFQTEIAGYNELGAMVGSYDEVPLGMGGDHQFVRDTKGNITSFDVPGGGSASAINNFGVIIGTGNNGGFLRVPY